MVRQLGGGSEGLAELIDAHGEAIEADLQHHYRIDLRDLYRPGGGPSQLTARRAVALIERLPDTSCLVAELSLLPPPDAKPSGPRAATWRDHYGWGADRNLLAATWDLLAATAHAGSKKAPPTYPRPARLGARAAAVPGYTPLRRPGR